MFGKPVADSEPCVLFLNKLQIVLKKSFKFFLLFLLVLLSMIVYRWVLVTVQYFNHDIMDTDQNLCCSNWAELWVINICTHRVGLSYDVMDKDQHLYFSIWAELKVKTESRNSWAKLGFHWHRPTFALLEPGCVMTTWT